MAQNKQQERINKWITTLETKAQLLLDCEIDEMTSAERMSAGARIISLIQRFIALEQQIEASTPEGAANIMTAALLRKLRGEDDGEEEDG
jgi:phosphoglycerate-specific signal transduction histidine kinase